MCQTTTFFTPRGPLKFDLDFCTTIQNSDDKFDNVWNRFAFNEDIILFLKKYGQLPVTNLRTIMDTKVEKEQLEADKEELLAEN